MRFLPENWQQATLSHIARSDRTGLVDGPFGSDLPSSSYRESGVPVIRGNNLSKGEERFKDCGFVYVSEETAMRLSRSLCVPDDIVFTKKGTLGQIGIIPREGVSSKYLLSSNQMKLSVDPTKADPLFIYYQLASQQSIQKIIRDSEHTGVPKINLAYLKSFPVVVPPIKEQRAISAFLDALDSKIELNRRMNATLEQMAHALFKSWFVDFDPVKAKAKEFVSDGILEIGDGYRAKNDELGEPGLPFIRAANLNNGFDTENAERLSEESVARAGNKISRVGDIAFTSKGTIGRFARVGEMTERFVYSPQVCFWRSLDKAHLHPAVLYCWMQTDDFKAQVLAVAGQTDMAPYVSLRDQREMSVPRFHSSQAEIGPKLESLLTHQSLNNAESRTLAALRDALLPRLISGQLRIPDIEQTEGGV
jgi:type I restriction enzyme, S subunit